jgi:K+-transporting ATPase c subunit
MSEDQVKALVAEPVDGLRPGAIGEPHANVLALNLALDEAGMK